MGRVGCVKFRLSRRTTARMPERFETGPNGHVFRLSGPGKRARRMDMAGIGDKRRTPARPTSAAQPPTRYGTAHTTPPSPGTHRREGGGAMQRRAGRNGPDRPAPPRIRPAQATSTRTRPIQTGARTSPRGPTPEVPAQRERALKAALRADLATCLSGCTRPIASSTSPVAGWSTRHALSKKPVCWSTSPRTSS